MNKDQINTHRYIAWFCLETEAPLRIGSGEKGLENQELIARAANGLPYIPGSGLSGVLRHHLEDKEGLDYSPYFGFQREKEGEGSRLTVSAAYMLAKDGKSVLEAFSPINFKDDFYQQYLKLTERDHVRISHKGSAKTHAKFQEELVFKGTRFCTELEFLGTNAEEDQTFFEELCLSLRHNYLELGAGTRNGLGAFKIIKLHSHIYDLIDKDERTAYLGRSSSLNSGLALSGGKVQDKNLAEIPDDNWSPLELSIKAENFFYFGSGQIERYKQKSASTPYKENDKAKKEELSYVWKNQLPKTERIVSWKQGEASIQSNSFYLIPATSIKGALSHRTAFHYNKSVGNYIDQVESWGLEKVLESFDLEKALAVFRLPLEVASMNYDPNSEKWKEWANRIDNWNLTDSEEWMRVVENMEILKKEKELYGEMHVEEKNDAVRAIFGYAKEAESPEDGSQGQRGKIIISDIYLPVEVKKKVLNHVSIDRFTGGAMDHHLFEETVLWYDAVITLKIKVEKSVLQNKAFREALHEALKELQTGQLQLGGNVAKGHGVFKSVDGIKEFEFKDLQ